MKTIYFILLILFIYPSTSSVSSEKIMMTKLPSAQSVKDTPQKKWDMLAGKKIFFGHQSVGYNIITGLQELLKNNQHIKLNIFKMTDIKNLNLPFFSHEWIGQNTMPISKLKAFEAILNSDFGSNIDIAFMKFCYVDITSETDIDKLFVDYKQVFDRLKQQHPNIIFVHITTPLTAKPHGFTAIKFLVKNFIKKIIGKPVFDYKDNIKRNLFNAKMKAEYAGMDPLFDLASLEADCSEGRTASFSSNKNTFLTLANECTYDGGHLNETGARKIGEQLLVFLAQLSQ